MILYKIGKIIKIGKTYLIFESNNQADTIFIAKPNEFQENQNTKLFLFEYKNEYVNDFYGFKIFEERMLFEDLIGVPGIGPKTALALLKGEHAKLIHYIASGNVEALSSMPFIGSRTCRQLIFELQNKYKHFDKLNKQPSFDANQITSTLKTLGFNKKQINYAIMNVNPAENMELMVESAIKLIANANR
jgi:Holliday junction DNA helicase RuvA